TGSGFDHELRGHASGTEPGHVRNCDRRHQLHRLLLGPARPQENLHSRKLEDHSMPTTFGLTDTETQSLHEDYLHLHRNPELSMQEHNTAAYIESKLSEL